jgi:hypothetical protein
MGKVNFRFESTVQSCQTFVVCQTLQSEHLERTLALARPSPGRRPPSAARRSRPWPLAPERVAPPYLREEVS